MPLHSARHKCDYLIVGGGIVGLATASRLRALEPDASIILLEKESTLAAHQTGRNSGVIHAGVYYKPRSLKAEFCRRGSAQTMRFCEEHNIPYEQCGKLIVATDLLETSRLNGLEERARANGLDITRLSGPELQEREPNIKGEAALLVKASGIVNYAQISAKLGEELIGSGCEILFGQQVQEIHEESDKVIAATADLTIEAGRLIACAGLEADRLASLCGLADDFAIVPFRGEYFRLADAHNDIVQHLIYPVPDPNYPFLGVHLTRMIEGSVTVGPNAMMSFGRENYGANWPVAKDLAKAMVFPGFWKLAAKNLAAGFSEAQGSLSKRIYLKRCQKYCPKLELSDLLPYPTGIRAQAVSRSGEMIDDFLIKQTRRSLHVCNAPSPAATSAFPIAEEIVRRLHAEYPANCAQAATLRPPLTTNRGCLPQGL